MLFRCRLDGWRVGGWVSRRGWRGEGPGQQGVRGGAQSVSGAIQVKRPRDRAWRAYHGCPEGPGRE